MYLFILQVTSISHVGSCQDDMHNNQDDLQTDSDDDDQGRSQEFIFFSLLGGPTILIYIKI